MRKFIEAIEIFFDRASVSELRRHFIDKTLDEVPSSLNLEAARSDATADVLVSKHCYANAALEKDRAKGLRAIASLIGHLVSERSYQLEKIARDRIDVRDGIKVKATDEKGFVLHVEQHGDSIAYFTCAVQQINGEWSVRDMLREDIERCEEFE